MELQHKTKRQKPQRRHTDVVKNMRTAGVNSRETKGCSKMATEDLQQ